MTRTASRVATAVQLGDGDAEPAGTTDEREALDAEVDDVLVEEVSIDGLCGVY